jgi:hypothetical protein
MSQTPKRGRSRGRPTFGLFDRFDLSRFHTTLDVWQSHFVGNTASTVRADGKNVATRVQEEAAKSAVRRLNWSS